MTMKLSDIYAQDLLNEAMTKVVPYKSAVLNTGLLKNDPALETLLVASQGRKIENVGYVDFADPLETGNAAQTTTSNPAYSDDSDTVIGTNNISTYTQWMVKCMVNFAFGEKQVVRTVNYLPDPVDAMNGMVAGYWARYFDKYGIAQLKGVYANNVANNSSDMIAGDGSEVIDNDLILDAFGTMGDAAMVDGVMILHSKQKLALQKLQLIEARPAAENPAVAFEYYFGTNIRVIVSDNVPVVAAGEGTTGTATAIIAMPGVLGFNESTQGIIPSDYDYNPAIGQGAGEAKVITRKQFAMAPMGHSWTDTTVTGSVATAAIGGIGGTKLFPCIADQALAANWTRVLDRKSIPLAFLTTKIADALPEA